MYIACNSFDEIVQVQLDDEMIEIKMITMKWLLPSVLPLLRGLMKASLIPTDKLVTPSQSTADAASDSEMTSRGGGCA